jgi:hypothetical protein
MLTASEPLLIGAAIHGGRTSRNREHGAPASGTRNGNARDAKHASLQLASRL